jgi:hypothetical protein
MVAEVIALVTAGLDNSNKRGALRFAGHACLVNCPAPG